MEKRLIDANRLKAELRKSAEYHAERRLGYFSAIDHIDEQPTVDAVELVRCEDCTNYMNDTAYCKNHDKGYCCLDDAIKQKNHYCGYAELKKEEHNG